MDQLKKFVAAGQAAQAAVDKITAERNFGDRPVKIVLSSDTARALHWLVRHHDFADALASVPPHFSNAMRSDRAYELVHAGAALQSALEEADQFGDSWMCRE
jgi:hypothetical protein